MRINSRVYREFVDFGTKSVLSKDEEDMHLFCFTHDINKHNARKALINGALWTVVVTVLRLYRTYSLPLDIVEELLHEGYVALNDCLDLYYDGKSYEIKFSSYAYNRVYGVLRHWVRDNDVYNQNIMSLNTPIKVRSTKSDHDMNTLELQDLLMDQGFEDDILKKIDTDALWDRIGKCIGKTRAILLSIKHGHSSTEPYGLYYREMSSVLGKPMRVLREDVLKAHNKLRKNRKAQEVLRDTVL